MKGFKSFLVTVTFLSFIILLAIGFCADTDDGPQWGPFYSKAVSVGDGLFVNALIGNMDPFSGYLKVVHADIELLSMMA